MTHKSWFLIGNLIYEKKLIGVRSKVVTGGLTGQQVRGVFVYCSSEACLRGRSHHK